MTSDPGPLLSLEDLGQREGADEVTGDQLDSAAAIVRGYCDWHLAPRLERTVEVSGRGQKLLVLPTRALDHVLEVVDVERDGQPVHGWRRTGNMLFRRDGWPVGEHNLAVRLVDGYTTLPADLITAVLTIALSADAIPAGVRSETETVGERTTSRVYFVEGLRSGASGFPPALAGILDRHSVMW